MARIEPDDTQLPFPDIAQDTAPVVPRHAQRVEWAFAEGEEHNLFPRDITVLLYICHRAGGKNGVCFSDRETMANACTKGSIDSLKKILIRLRKAGLIRTYRQSVTDQNSYIPTCVRGADSAPHECRPGTTAVPTGHHGGAESAPQRARHLIRTRISKETIERDLENPPRARAREGEREEGLSSKEKEYVRILEQRYATTHKWNDVEAAARIYARDPNRFNIDRDRWDRQLAKDGRCAYCGADGITEWLRGAGPGGEESRYGRCPHCFKSRPVDEPRREPARDRRY